MISKEKFIAYLHYIEFLMVLVDENPNQGHIKGILKLLQSEFPLQFDAIHTHIFTNKTCTNDELYELVTK